MKALLRGANILILDEPTAVLTPAEADGLFVMLRKLKHEGKTVILITHKLREIMAVTDRVSVMRRGEIVETVDTAATSPTALADAMVGRRVSLTVSKEPCRARAAAARGPQPRGAGPERHRRWSTTCRSCLRAGEIAGLAGVAGNGQSELLEALAGMRPLASGDILIDGSEVPPEALNPKAHARAWA